MPSCDSRDSKLSHRNHTLQMSFEFGDGDVEATAIFDGYDHSILSNLRYFVPQVIHQGYAIEELTCRDVPNPLIQRITHRR